MPTLETYRGLAAVPGFGCNWWSSVHGLLFTYTLEPRCHRVPGCPESGQGQKKLTGTIRSDGEGVMSVANGTKGTVDGTPCPGELSWLAGGAFSAGLFQLWGIGKLRQPLDGSSR